MARRTSFAQRTRGLTTRPDDKDLAEKRWNWVLTSSSPSSDFLRNSSIRSCLAEADMGYLGGKIGEPADHRITMKRAYNTAQLAPAAIRRTEFDVCTSFQGVICAQTYLVEGSSRALNIRKLRSKVDIQPSHAATLSPASERNCKLFLR